MSPPNRHVVVDGSNIATEGRSLPSLEQLDEAVQAFIAEHPKTQVTVVVDATFAHRIKPKERKTFEAAVDAGEIVVPPAGAVGRGDAFILQVAAKANSVVLSNDSFQEFHGEHPWLFDAGRLIGAKPVEGVGWIFVDRVPVRGQESRRATRAASSGRATKGRTTKKSKGDGKGSPTTAAKAKRERADGKKPRQTKSSDRAKSGRKPAGRSNKKSDSTAKPAKRQTGSAKPDKKAGRSSDSKSSTKPSSSKTDTANTPDQFLRFVTRHSIGDTVVGTVDEFSSHGCYLQIASARVYLPSKAMGDPPPSRARDVVSVGQKVRVRVESLDADRRGINVELIEVLDTTDKRGNQKRASSQRRRGKQKESSQKPTSVADGSAREANLTRSKTIVAKSTKKSPARRAKKSAKKATSGAKKTAKATPSTRAKKAAAKKAPASRAAKKATKKAAPKKAAAKKSTKKATASRTAKKAAPKKAAPKKAAAKKSAKKATKKAAPKKAAAKKATASRTAKKAAPKKAAPKKAAAKKSAKKATKKAAPKKAAAKKATASRTAKKSGTQESGTQEGGTKKGHSQEVSEEGFAS